jgi:hypothetical protein
MRNNAPFKSDPVKADDRALSVRLDANAPLVPIEWKDLSPLFLVKVFLVRAATLQDPAQRAELLWGAGTLHLLLGSKKSAAEFFEEAAKLNPAYRQSIQTLAAAESTP